MNSGWHDLEHVGRIPELVHRLGDGDWLVLQTKGDEANLRYAQLMGNEGNEPGTPPGDNQWLTRADAIDVVSAWARGGRFLSGYGACLHMY
ncbi:hypothetical protein [Arthrobacter sp. KK5.5]|uniref:hypothetical protein n=1 Tax=Arthrobacter sp. KK5.5 TaxID=3373084 RepID=UPI003EE51C02